MRAFASLVTALLWAGTLLLALVFVTAAAILLLPVDYRLRVQVAGGSVRWQATFRWAWGAVAAGTSGGTAGDPEFDLRLAGLRLRKGAVARGEPRPRRRPRERRRARRSPIPALRTVLQRDLLETARQGLRRLWRAMGLEARGDLRYGWEDPALTGMTQGVLAALPLPRGFRLAASYVEPGIAGWVEGRGRLVPVRLAGVALGILWERPVRRLWWGEVKRRLRAVRRGSRRRRPPWRGSWVDGGTRTSKHPQSA